MSAVVDEWKSRRFRRCTQGRNVAHGGSIKLTEVDVFRRGQTQLNSCSRI